ncbi:MAG TPA: hydantoinase B/oxoprolinase family protein, partial [Thermomicrobiaceae bacterium]|nr:hydantoinase B/oxoprolinase family protein [Thermomicrobiaceae bacterium]
ESLRPGDVLITNNPWQTSGHLHDFTVMTPVFRRQDSVLVGFFGNTCHVLDIGGRGFGTDAQSVFEEGLHVPITKLYDGGRENEELFKLIAANVRTPEPVLGDIHAQVSANDVGGSRLLEFLDEFGLDSIDPLGDEIISRSERAMRQAISTVPDGVYAHEIYSDGYDAPVRLRATITKRGDELAVDWSGSSPESSRGINVVLNYTHAYTTYALKCMLAPEVPNNEGSFRPVMVTAPPGCILNAQPPAPVGGRHVLGHFLPLVVMGALAGVLPSRVMAEGAANIWSLQFSGRYDDGQPWTYVWFSSGGTGARPDADGLSTTAFPSGIAGVPVEVIESLAPIVIRERELTTDSGGPGRFRGGCGQQMRVVVRTGHPFTLSPLFDRVHFAAAGMAGGLPGGPASIEASDGTRFDTKGARTFAPGVEITLRLPGGGGFFDPKTREPERVIDDIVDGLVSVDAARRDFGLAGDTPVSSLNGNCT